MHVRNALAYAKGFFVKASANMRDKILEQAHTHMQRARIVFAIGEKILEQLWSSWSGNENFASLSWLVRSSSSFFFSLSHTTARANVNVIIAKCDLQHGTHILSCVHCTARTHTHKNRLAACAPSHGVFLFHYFLITPIFSARNLRHMKVEEFIITIQNNLWMLHNPEMLLQLPIYILHHYGCCNNFGFCNWNVHFVHDICALT